MVVLGWLYLDLYTQMAQLLPCFLEHVNPFVDMDNTNVLMHKDAYTGREQLNKWRMMRGTMVLTLGPRPSAQHRTQRMHPAAAAVLLMALVVLLILVLSSHDRLQEEEEEEEVEGHLHLQEEAPASRLIILSLTNGCKLMG